MLLLRNLFFVCFRERSWERYTSSFSIFTALFTVNIFIIHIYFLKISGNWITLVLFWTTFCCCLAGVMFNLTESRITCRPLGRPVGLSYERRAKLSNKTADNMLVKMCRKEEPSFLLMGFFKKPKNKSSIWASNITPLCMLKGYNILLSLLQKYLLSHVHCRSSHVARKWNQPKYPSTDEWIIKKHGTFTLWDTIQL